MPRALSLPFLALTAGLAVAADVETFTIKTLQAQMRYDVTDLEVKPGANVKIVFENTDDMPHNLVSFQPGTNVVEVCTKQLDKPEEALKRNWLPEDPRMWLHSKMLNPHEKEEITFKAPEKPGAYPFVCTFPGHAMTMQGRIRVTAPGPKLTSGHFAMYLGDWKKLPDFSTLKPHREGELDGLVEIKLDDYKNQFGVVYTGKLNAPKDDEYTFFIASDDGSRLLIDGKKVVEHDGIHPASDIKPGKIRLKEGDHDFRLEYFQSSGGSELYVGWQGANFSVTPLSKWIHPSATGASLMKKKDENVGMPIAVGKEPVIYRNFIAGAGQRGIAVGYPGGFNIVWSAEQMNLALIWRGAFIDAARHWNNRGGGAQPPLGFDALSPNATVAQPLAVPSTGAEWPKPDKNQRPEGYAWKGYKLDAKRFPTFFYEWNGAKVSDRIDVEGEAISGKGQIIRTIKVDGKLPEAALLRVASADKIKQSGNAFLVEAGKLRLGNADFDNRFLVTVDGGKVVGKDLVVPARAETRITYSWPGGHTH
jgi:azurin